ncbi:polyketide synthase [Roseovarius sp. MBR-78]|jgi:hypothetical protein|uniref:polyketide synthase n=1 Tax=Roseovarius sp. MBR-78 TaxID=3156460 RepID=UPI003391456D
MERLIRIWPLHVVVTLLILALASSGFAHRFATPDDLAATAYMQAFGLDAGAICGDVDGDGAASDCEACRLHAGMSLPVPAISEIVIQLSLGPADWTPAPPVLYAPTAEAARPARAPPIV